ncbi:GNAT family N-acetyltransferase [Anaerosolibacter sp.]|uniref:GNAT family N-acetyltransferase n=1 Tax=Anaerosolibacter sp. TaxID=1872527 RepID=UPI0039EF3A41
MIQKIEELSMNALPALSTMLVNGWVLRFANGYSKRANSVNPIYPCSVEVERNIEICDGLFKRNNLDTVFKLTEMEDAYRIDEILGEMGYSYEAKTNIMLKSIEKYSIKEEDKRDVILYRELRDDWFEAFVGMNKIGPQHGPTLQKMLKSIIPDTYYGCIVENGKITAVGLGVAERGYVGMYDICVAQEQRRRGLGTKIMKNLIHKASEDGYTYSYLQVVDANEAAKLLYDNLGYEKKYSYWYRVKKFHK